MTTLTAKRIGWALRAAIATLAIVLSSAPVAQAVIVQDQFVIGSGDYTAGSSIAGQSSASAIGLSGSWNYVNTGIMRPNTEDLTYGAGGSVVGQLATGGGSVQMDLSPYNDSRREVTHDLAPFATAGTYYMSGLVSVPADSNGEAFIRLEGGGTTSLGFGFLNQQAILRTGSPSTTVPSTPFVADRPAFFVVKAEVDALGSNERLSVWVNPTQYSSEAAAGPAKLVMDTTDAWDNANLPTTLRVLTQNLGGSGIAKFDEVRLGTNWDDVVVRQHPNWTHVGFQEDVVPTASYQHLGGEARQNSPTSSYGTDTNIRAGHRSDIGDMRTLLAFDLEEVPDIARIEEITLRMTVDSVWQQANVGDIELHRILPGPNGEVMVEGQASWANRTSTLPWTTPGGDFDTAVLAMVPASVTATLGDGMEMVFDSSTALVAAAQDAFDSGLPLELILVTPTADNGFIRFRSDDWGSGTGQLTRPVLSIAYSVPEPSALILSATGLLGLIAGAGCRRRRRKPDAARRA